MNSIVSITLNGHLKDYIESNFFDIHDITDNLSALFTLTSYDDQLILMRYLISMRDDTSVASALLASKYSFSVYTIKTTFKKDYMILLLVGKIMIDVGLVPNLDDEDIMRITSDHITGKSMMIKSMYDKNRQLGRSLIYHVDGDESINDIYGYITDGVELVLNNCEPNRLHEIATTIYNTYGIVMTHDLIHDGSINQLYCTSNRLY